MGQHTEFDKDIPERPLTYLFSQVSIPKNYYEGISRNLPFITILDLGQNEFRFDSPSEFHNRFGEAISLDYECNVWKRYPKNFRVAEAIEKGSWFSRYGISMVARVPALSQFRRFNLPAEQSTIQLFFKSKGFEVKRSKIDQYSNALIDLLGGIDGVEILASKPVYQLLDILALKSTKKIAQRIIKELNLQEDLPDKISKLLEEMELPQELKDIPRTINQLASDQRIGQKKKEVLDLIDKLTQAQLLKRGFYLPCPNCGTSEWYPLQTISEFVICPGCSYEFILPARESENSEFEMQWRYRLNTTVNRAFDQDALVAILATYHITKNKQSACHNYGLELWKEDTIVTDLDFLFVIEQKIHAGECKAGERIGDKDFQTAKIAASLGFDKFYFCTISQFESETITKIENLKLELEEAELSTEIIILSGADLLGESM